jgi:hypothetical protein
MPASLVTHCGARVVDRAALRAVPTPEPTRTWFPLGHHEVLEVVESTLREGGFNIDREQLALSRTDARFFGTLDLASVVAPGVTLAIGIRNSTDKSLPIGFCAGSRVFICDNLAFNSEVTIARKHTRHSRDRYAEALALAVSGLSDFQKAEAERIKRFQKADVTDIEAESLMLRAYDQAVISHRLLPRVIKEWRKPTFEDFEPRTLWSIYNAFTTVLGERRRTNMQQFASLTVKLSGLFADFAGIVAGEPEQTLSA